MGKRFCLPGLVLFIVGIGLVYVLFALPWLDLMLFSWFPGEVREGILYFLLGCAGTLAVYYLPFGQTLPAPSALKELEEKREVLESYWSSLQERLALLQKYPTEPYELDRRLKKELDTLSDALHRIIIIAMEGKAKLSVGESPLVTVLFVLIGGLWAAALTGGLWPAQKKLLPSQSFLFGLAWAGLSTFLQVLWPDLFFWRKEKEKIRAEEKSTCHKYLLDKLKELEDEAQGKEKEKEVLAVIADLKTKIES